MEDKNVDNYEEYEPLKLAITQLIIDLITHIQSKWKVDWGVESPRVNVHFNYWELTELPTFKKAKNVLLQLSSISSKYPDDWDIEKPLITFVRIVVESIPKPSLVNKAIDQFWPLMCGFLNAKDIPVRIIIGLANFEATQDEFILNPETKILFFETDTLAKKLDNLSPFWYEGLFSIQPPSLTHYHGIIQIDFSISENTMHGYNFTSECNRRKLLVSNSLRLSTFGRIIIGPSIETVNPKLPAEGVFIFGEPKLRETFDDQPFLFDGNAWSRFQNIYTLLERLDWEDRNGIKEGHAIRRRFKNAIFKFTKTFDQGLWESVVVDLVILMESILTPNKQGGRMQLAVAASNLLGTNQNEVREVYENIINMYKIRNEFVHGEPTGQETWEKKLLEIANQINPSLKKLEGGVRNYIFEVMRDYARRSIVALLNLYYEINRSPSESFTYDLHRLHIDAILKESIQRAAKCYPVFERPSPTIKRLPP